ncbi:MAG: hypothetical protein K8S21_13185 [Gemmatimonadetes bacterium]|nr:hypothetical protein [Gemmatimonadota bacterium]
MRAAAPLLVLGLLVGCSLPGEPAADSAIVRGEWAFTGTQTAPQATLTGSLTIQTQTGDLITGSAGWDERDGFGVVRSAGGPVSGRVIGEQDVDFDIESDGVTRRHVGRIRADTMDGSWVQFGDGRTGSFRAVRARR